jgi:pyruvate/2-oxoglutarate dehydrogenase complex dihydrolipoamide acyltransferase (E2) component
MGMSEGTITRWAIKEGERVERDAVLVSIETEKIVTDLPSPYSGFVHVAVPVGEVVPIDTLIARIADTEQEYVQLMASEAAVASAAAARSSDIKTVTGQPPEATVSGSAAAKRLRVSGLARKLAGEHGIDPASITGTGPGGRIEREDVLDALANSVAARDAVRPRAQEKPGRERERARIPFTGMRKAIAEHLVASKTTAAGVYLFAEMDVTALVAMRESLLAREQELGARVSMTALYAKGLASAIREVPLCNSTLIGDEIIIWNNVNVAVAVALPGKHEYDSGLITPVVREVDNKGLLAIDRDIKDLVARARSGTLTAQDTAEGTVNLSSSDGFFPGGWLVGTPLLNLPMVVSFNPGTPIQKPVVIEGQVAVRTILPCGLTFDHRALDGAPSARLLRQIAHYFAHPELMAL